LPTNNRYWGTYASFIKVLGQSIEYRNMVITMVSYLNLKPGDEVLDAGCGNGQWICWYRDLVGKIVGVDGQPEMLAAARLKLGQDKKVELVHANLNQRMPFADGSFDEIVNVLVLGYLQNRDLALDELVRVLRPGGRIAIATPIDGAKFYKILKEEAKHRKSEGSFLRDLKRLPLGLIAIGYGKVAELKCWVGEYHFYSQNELEQALVERGLKIIYSGQAYAKQGLVIVAEKPGL